MLIGMVRPTETRELTAEGDSLESVHRALEAKVPAGWKLTDAKVAMIKGSTALTVAGKAARWGDVREIEADDMPSLEAKVPDGWQLLSVRRV